MRPNAERRFRAMGTDCHVVAVGPRCDDHVDLAIARIEELESRWSRFIEDSEVSKLNRADGTTVAVSRDTYRLVTTAIGAWRLTGGLFDPTLGKRLAALGYDTSFETIESSPNDMYAAASRGCADIVCDAEALTVRIPVGTGFDAGGIGKGLAADIVTGELVDDGSWGAMVNLGGDLRVRGLSPEGDEWVVTIREPAISDDTLATAHLNDGGLATSTTSKRRWRGPRGMRHHVLDPQTGQPTATDVVLSSVVAGEAWWAEAAATALLVASPDTRPACAGLQVTADGRCRRIGGFERYES